MNADQVLFHLDRVASNTDAIPRIRRLILDLAIGGKLVPQDPEDEPATELLRRIAREKLRRGRKAKESDGGQTDKAALQQVSAKLPNGWATAPLADLVTVLNGRAYAKNELLAEGTPVLRVGNLFTSDRWYYSDLSLDSDKYCEEGDLLFAWSASFGPFIWSGPKAIYHYHIWKLELHSPEDIDKHYLYNFLLQQTGAIKDLGHGVSMLHMTKAKMNRISVPVPPLAEQKRIVAKVAELMAFCDRLEKATAERELARDRVSAAIVSGIARRRTAPDHSDARLALSNLNVLTARPDQIKRVRKAILGLAVRGELVRQDPRDEPASEILSRIAEQKSQLKERRARGPVTRGDSPKFDFMLPPGWALSTLGAVTLKITDGAHHTPTYLETGVPFVSVKDFSSGNLDLSKTRFISHEEHRELYRRCDPKRGDILIGRIGTLGRPVLIETDVEFSLFVSVAMIRFSRENIDPQFFRILLASPFIEMEFDRIKIGGAMHTNKLNLGDLNTVVIPLPPVSEQRRIVTRVDQLMRVCDRLEQSLRSRDALRDRLLAALIAEAVAA